MVAISRGDRLNDNQGTSYLSAISIHGSAHGTLDAMMAGHMHHHSRSLPGSTVTSHSNFGGWDLRSQASFLQLD